MALMTSVGGDCPGSAEELFNAVFLSAMAGCRVMAVIANKDDDASALAQAVGLRMEAAGATVMAVTALPGATVRDLLDQVATVACAGGSDALVTQLLQGEDAGLLTVARAHLLDAAILESLLSLSQVESGDGRFLQVLLAGNAALNAHLDRHDKGAAVQRWLLENCRSAEPVRMPAQMRPQRPASGNRKPSPAGASRLLRRLAALAFLFIVGAGAGLFAADHFRTGVTLEPIEAKAAEAPVEPSPAAVQSTAPAMALLISTDHGPMPTVRPGETVVVRVETTADAFVYCYYLDGFGQVARIFPNRFQPDAFVPATRPVEIPSGPEPPFNIRADVAGRVEAVACLASSTEVDRSRIGDAEAEDLTPLPGLALRDILYAFAGLSDAGGTGVRSLTMPIVVVNRTENP